MVDGGWWMVNSFLTGITRHLVVTLLVRLRRPDCFYSLSTIHYSLFLAFKQFLTLSFSFSDIANEVKSLLW
jgi:hypothetical protein